MSKKNRMKILITVLIILLFHISDLQSQWHPYDVYRCGAKGVAAGGAFTAVADDISAVYFNPAGLIHAKFPSIFYTMDAQIKFQGRFDPKMKLTYQVPAILGFIYPLRNKHMTVIGFAIDSPFQRKIPKEFAVYKFAPQISFEIIKNLAIGINIGLNYATYSKANSSEGLGWGFQAGLLYYPDKEFRIGLNYQSKIKIHWDTHGYDFDVEETFPDILTSGIAYALTSQLVGSIDIEFQNWKGIEYIKNGIDEAPVDKIDIGLFKTIHPHIGIMFLEKSSGAHLRTGFYTDSFIEYNSVGELLNRTQLLWTIGIGAFALKVFKIEASLTDSYLTHLINNDNNKIETLQITIEYRFGAVYAKEKNVTKHKSPIKEEPSSSTNQMDQNTTGTNTSSSNQVDQDGLNTGVSNSRKEE